MDMNMMDPDFEARKAIQARKELQARRAIRARQEEELRQSLKQNSVRMIDRKQQIIVRMLYVMMALLPIAIVVGVASGDPFHSPLFIVCCVNFVGLLVTMLVLGVIWCGASCPHCGKYGAGDVSHGGLCERCRKEMMHSEHPEHLDEILQENDRDRFQ